MHEPSLLLAGAGDVIAFLIFLVITISTIVGQLIKANAKPQQPPPRNRPQPVPPRPAAGNPGRQSSDIDRFLQDVSQRIRREQAPEPWTPPEQAIEAVPVADEVGSFDTSRFERPITTLSSTIEQADEAVETRLVQEFEHQVGQLRDSTIGVEDLPIAQGTDAPVWTEHTGEPGQPIAAGPALAQEIVAMLRDPRDVRRAVILNEILSPPRWTRD